MDCKIFCMRLGDRSMNPKSRNFENKDDDVVWNIHWQLENAETYFMDVTAMIVQMGANFCKPWNDKM